MKDEGIDYEEAVQVLAEMQKTSNKIGAVEKKAGESSKAAKAKAAGAAEDDASVGSKKSKRSAPRVAPEVPAEADEVPEASEEKPASPKPKAKGKAKASAAKQPQQAETEEAGLNGTPLTVEEIEKNKSFWDKYKCGKAKVPAPEPATEEGPRLKRTRAKTSFADALLDVKVKAAEKMKALAVEVDHCLEDDAASSSKKAKKKPASEPSAPATLPTEREKKKAPEASTPTVTPTKSTKKVDEDGNATPVPDKKQFFHSGATARSW